MRAILARQKGPQHAGDLAPENPQHRERADLLRRQAAAPIFDHLDRRIEMPEHGEKLEIGDGNETVPASWAAGTGGRRNVGNPDHEPLPQTRPIPFKFPLGPGSKTLARKRKRTRIKKT
jgi:hypothetical protein